VTVRTEAAPRPRLTGRAALLLIVLTVLAVFSTVPVREYLSQRSRIAELERQARTLEQENAGLRTDMAKLYDPAELERLARECLGMVAPGEIEAFLMTHPDVVQAFVVGVPDPKLNEAPVAYVIAVEGSRLTEDELRNFCRGKIASYKIPIAVRLVKDVPRTPGPHGDKVQRAVLREQAIKEMRR